MYMYRVYIYMYMKNTFQDIQDTFAHGDHIPQAHNNVLYMYMYTKHTRGFRNRIVCAKQHTCMYMYKHTCMYIHTYLGYFSCFLLYTEILLYVLQAHFSVAAI